MHRLPRDHGDDYTHGVAAARRQVVSVETGTQLDHIAGFSFDPGILRGNIEGFSGVAQVPLGFAGPLLVHGEHARGEYFVPLATTEGTLVASYSRGMRLTREAGGITATVIDDAMQRAPVFVFQDARDARDFGHWVQENFATIKGRAEETSRFGRLRDIEQYALGPMRWLRFNFITGDAAGQNMVTKAVHEACQWMIDQRPPGLKDFALAGNLDTDKKHSSMNNLHTRGKRVVAEVTLPAELIEDLMHTSAKQLYRLRQLSDMGTLLGGGVSNGSQYANGIAAMFIACGQDVGNVAEASAGFSFGELRDDGSYYCSVTIPSLIVATVGGGTGLPTQRECLETLGCYGPGRVRAFAEIVAATVLCGELSLGSAIAADEWVSSHEAHGRNRPADSPQPIP
ncbi:MAG: hydroxymethylglutaryl-CoA reductase [Acidimicrobiales bacterium]|jgi:hydroxymethylglutaryl-CoA reductase (NADPH)